MVDRSNVGRGHWTRVAGVTARAALVVGSVAMAVRAALPRPQSAPASDDPSGRAPSSASGRGHATIAASRQALSAGHETTDMSASVMARVMITLAGMAVTMVLLMVGFQSLFIPSRDRQQAMLPPEALTHPPPPPPNLQVDPVSDIAHLHAAEDHLLDRYARIDATHARIPIDRAMTLVVGRHLDNPP